MQDATKTKQQPFVEMAHLRQQNAALQIAAEEGLCVEQALRESEARFRSLVETTSDWVWEVNEHMVYTYVSPKVRELLGYEPKEVLGRAPFDLMPVEEAERIRTIFAAIVAARRPFARLENTNIHKEGYRVILETSGVPLFGEDDTFRGYRGIDRDITDRKRAEEALKQSEANLQAIFNSSPQSLLLIDRNLTIQAFNQKAHEWIRELLGKDIRKGEAIASLLPPERSEAFHRHFQSALRGNPVTIRRNLSEFNRRRSWIEASYNPVLTGDGDISGVCLSVEDITHKMQAEIERKHLEEQLYQSQKMEAIGTLAGGIAHDFNNVLAAIMGYTELATHDVPQTSRTWNHLQQVLIASKRAKSLVQQILAFSRQHEKERKPVLLHLVVTEVLRLLRSSLPTTIEMRQRIPEDSGIVLADPTQMHQVLMNLCANAEHVMRQTGGILEVCLDAVEVDDDFAAQHPALQFGPYVRLMVRDTGYGMTPDVIERIFEPFYTTKTVGEGTGMGLAVVHGIVTAHGGAIMVDSTPGEGTTFTIYLPRTTESVSNTQPSENPPPHRKGRILFVDDEEALARLGQAMLEHLGYEVVSKTSSVEALDAFRETPQDFDLVVTDQTMPHMTGEQLSRELRRARRDIPIVLCTGFSHVINAEKARSLGIDAFCMKPLVSEDLGRVIQQVLLARSENQPGSVSDKAYLGVS